MVKHDLDEQGWRKAGLCTYDDCVELKAYPDGVAVRDSAAPSGPVLRLDRAAFRDLARRIKQEPGK